MQKNAAQESGGVADISPTNRSAVTNGTKLFAFADISPTNRSAVTNGTKLFAFAEVDGRSIVARRFRDVLRQYIADLGGIEGTSEAERQLARRSAALAVKAEEMESKYAAGEEDLDVDRYCALVNGLGRALSRIGLKRRARRLPSLEEHVQARSKA